MCIRDRRRYAEKLAYYVNLLGGDGFARVHHGSLSKEQRAEVEEDLRAGRLRLLCATSSMELGIDVGDIDMFIQIVCPRTVSSTCLLYTSTQHTREPVGAKEQPDVLNLFSPPTASWFAKCLGTPTKVQTEAWPEIAAGRDLLVSAPTGTGKTLSAFLVSVSYTHLMSHRHMYGGGASGYVCGSGLSPRPGPADEDGLHHSLRDSGRHPAYLRAVLICRSSGNLFQPGVHDGIHLLHCGSALSLQMCIRDRRKIIFYRL